MLDISFFLTKTPITVFVKWWWWFRWYI